MQAADLVVVPVILAAREMDALLVPNMVPGIPPRRFVERLTKDAVGTRVAPPISEHRWLRRRLRRAAVTLELNPGTRLKTAAEEFRRVAAEVEATLAS
jgi:hypothetical protein